MAKGYYIKGEGGRKKLLGGQNSATVQVRTLLILEEDDAEGFFPSPAGLNKINNILQGVKEKYGVDLEKHSEFLIDIGIVDRLNRRKPLFFYFHPKYYISKSILLDRKSLLEIRNDFLAAYEQSFLCDYHLLKYDKSDIAKIYTNEKDIYCEILLQFQSIAINFLDKNLTNANIKEINFVEKRLKGLVQCEFKNFIQLGFDGLLKGLNKKIKRCSFCKEWMLSDQRKIYCSPTCKIKSRNRRYYQKNRERILMKGC